MSLGTTWTHFLLGTLAALFSAACTPVRAPAQMAQDECPAPWPTVAGSPEAGRVSIVLKYQMSSGFGMRRVLMGIDDVATCWRTAPAHGPFLEAGDIPVLSVPVPVGDHTFQTLVDLEGPGSLDQYRFEVRSSHKFRVESGKPLELSVIVYEMNRMDLKERPAIRYVEH